MNNTLEALLPWAGAAALIILILHALWTGSMKWRTRDEPITRRGKPTQYWTAMAIYMFFAGFFLWAGLR